MGPPNARMINPTVGENIAMPWALMRSRAVTFASAARLLGPRTGAAVAQLYRFCRTVDDLADDGGCEQAADAAFDDLRDAVSSRDLDHPVVGPVLAALGAHTPGAGALSRFLEAVAADRGPRRIADQLELVAYCEGVAGTVGEMSCELFGVTDPSARRDAIDLGVAMQLTNISRDVLEDARRSRRYLPATIADVDPAALVDGDPGARALAWRAVVRLVGHARSRYERASCGYANLPWRARAGVAAAAAGYREIGERIVRQGPDLYWQQRCVVPAQRRWRVAARAVAGCVIAAVTGFAPADGAVATLRAGREG